MDGQEAIAWKAPLGWSEAEAWTSWTDRKLWEIAWGKVRWEEARRKRGHRGRTGNRGSLGKSSLLESGVVFILHGVLSIDAWFSLASQRRKLNENPSIGYASA